MQMLTMQEIMHSKCCTVQTDESPQGRACANSMQFECFSRQKGKAVKTCLADINIVQTCSFDFILFFSLSALAVLRQCLGLDISY